MTRAMGREVLHSAAWLHVLQQDEKSLSTQVG